MKILEFLIYALLKTLNMLPRSIQFSLGKFLGHIFFRALEERREISRWNLKKCFPEKKDEEIDIILKKSFLLLGKSLFDFLNAFWASDNKLKELLINFGEIKKVSDLKNPSRGKLILFLSLIHI